MKTRQSSGSGWVGCFVAVGAVAAICCGATATPAAAPPESPASPASTLVDSQPDPAGGLRCTYQGNGGSTFTINTKLAACTAAAPGSAAAGTPAAASAAGTASKGAASADPAIHFVPGSPKLIGSTPAASGGFECKYELNGSFFTRTTHRAQCPATAAAPANGSATPKSSKSSSSAPPRAPTTKQTPPPPGEGTLVGSETKGSELVCKYKVGNQSFTRTTKKPSCPEHVRAP